MPTLSLLFVDQVSSTAQLHRLGDRAAAPLRRAFVEDLRRCVETAGGREIEFGGDGLFASFGGAADALGAAVAMQQAVAAADALAPDEVRLAIRVGVHTGEPIETEQGELFGIAVVVARRLCDLAAAGEILVSDLVRALLAPRREWDFEDRGTHELKGVGEPVRVAAASWKPIDLRGPQPASAAASEGLDPVARSRSAAWLLHTWQETNGCRVAVVPAHPAVVRALDELATLVHDDGGIVVDVGSGGALTERVVGALRDRVSALPALVRHLIGVSEHLGPSPLPLREEVLPLSSIGPVLVRCGASGTQNELDGLRHELAGVPSAAAPRVLVVVACDADRIDSIRGRMDDGLAVLDPATLVLPRAVAPPSGSSGASSAGSPVADVPTTRVEPSGNPLSLVFDDGREESLVNVVTVIGRSPGATVQVVDTSVSRRHAEIRVVGGQAMLRDLGSTNGTTVNGRPVTEHVLSSGDRIVLGSHGITVRG